MLCADDAAMQTQLSGLTGRVAAVMGLFRADGCRARLRERAVSVLGGLRIFGLDSLGGLLLWLRVGGFGAGLTERAVAVLGWLQILGLD